MRLLLDTHAFIWWAEEPDRLSQAALTACLDDRNQLVLSVASAWEMQIKLQLGKMRIGTSLAKLIELQRQVNEIRLLPVELGHVLAIGSLPLHHRDPFDRLIIAQARVEELVVVTTDPLFAAYGAMTLW